MTLPAVESLWGSWDLVRWRRISPDGAEAHPFTDGARGCIIYERSGRMSVFIVRPDWTHDETADGFVSYGGRFDLQDGKIHHLVEFASQKALVGSTQIRSADLVEPVLRLEAAAIGDGQIRQVLEWRRAT